jgi:hypothetical protein
LALPPAFQGRRILRNVNVASVGLSLAAATGSVLTALFSASGSMGWLPFFVGLPTLLIGSVWAGLLRLPRNFGPFNVRLGWVLSIPLAMLNAGVACAFLMLNEGTGMALGGVLGGFVLGVTFGALVWIPALLLTLVCFGLPIAWSQKLAERGLAGAERGEMIVGFSSAVVAALASLVLLSLPLHTVSYEGVAPSDLAGQVFLGTLCAAGIASGVLANLLAVARQRRRQRFVSEVSQGKVQGYRVDESAEGKVLVRVTSMGEGYRVTDFQEELFALDEQGEAKHELRAASAARRT